VPLVYGDLRRLARRLSGPGSRAPARVAIAAASSLPTRSVVRIVNHSHRSDWSAPWSSRKVVESSGSGFVIDGGLVMTNAHVVSDSRLLLVHVDNDPRPHEAEVVQIGHDCDLALIRTTDRKVLERIPPLRFGDQPALGTSVDTLGFPSGGLRVSSTRGVVSRIEPQAYVHSGADSHLAVQTDAAINPGSSGGPVIQDGRVVGVSFQANLELENVGYFIPPEVIERFLKDVADGTYDGYPELGADTAGLENAAARRRAGMSDEETGVRVYRVYHGSSADGKLLIGDIILEVEGRPVANDGSVADGQERIPYGMLVDRVFQGDAVDLRVLRDGDRRDVSVPLSMDPFWNSRRSAYDQQPRYYVYGGLVFTVLCRELLKTYGEDWGRNAPRTFLDDYTTRVLREPEARTRERIVLLRRLDDPVNAEMAWFLEQVIERVNGRSIDGLPTLIAAFEENEGDYHVIEYAHAGRFSVLDRRKTDAANAAILERYGVHKDRNP